MSINHCDIHDYYFGENEKLYISLVCPYCEIDRLKGALEEARAEVEKYKLACVPRLLPEWQSWIENHDKDTRQEVARTFLDLAEEYEGGKCELYDLVAKRFGLAG